MTGSDFYNMLPKGIGFENAASNVSLDWIMSMFPEISPEQQETLNKIFTSEKREEWEKIADTFSEVLNLERKDFLVSCEYATVRDDVIQDILYLKPLFISRAKVTEAALDRILADQDVIFTSNDETYRIWTINDENRKIWNPLAYDRERRRELYNGLSVWGTFEIRK